MPDYKSMTTELVAKNLSHVLVGLTTLVIAAVISAFYFGADYSSLFEDRAGEALDADVVDASIDYLSPTMGMKVKESGQITAIHTGKVTYKQNKYIVLPGDTLRIVAEKVYGDPEAWMPIMKANNLANPDVIEVGMELIIPR